jgi:hypothetical protein
LNKDNNPIREKITIGLELTHKKLIQHKKSRNLELVISVNGKIIHIRPEDLKEE